MYLKNYACFLLEQEGLALGALAPGGVAVPDPVLRHRLCSVVNDVLPVVDGDSALVAAQCRDRVFAIRWICPRGNCGRYFRFM